MTCGKVRETGLLVFISEAVFRRSVSCHGFAAPPEHCEWKFAEEKLYMYAFVENWLDSILEQPIPAEVAALNFNLYEEGGNNWSIELVGTESFDLEDEDWGCDEIFDFGTRENPLVWEEEKMWNEILDEMIQIMKRYLQEGKYAGVLKKYRGVGIGFVDGNIEILFVQ